MKKLKKILAVILVMAMMFGAIPMTSAFAEEVYDVLTLDTYKTVSYKGEDVTLSFIPENDGFYKFVSTGSYDTVATLYDSEYNELGYNDESKNSSNFEIISKLSAGEVYYLCVSEYFGDTASFKVKVTETVGVESATITKYPDNMTCVEGYEDSASLKGLEILFVTTDGEEISWAYGTYPFAGDFQITYNDSYAGDDGYYHVSIQCGGSTTELKFEIVENPVESIEYKSKHDIVLYEKTGGFTIFEDSFYYYYSLPGDAVFVINFKDGTSIECEEGDEINGEMVYTHANQYDEPWGVGTNYIYASYFGVQVAIPVYVESCPFKSITINSIPSREYIVGDYKYGYIGERNRYFFEPYDITDLSFTVEYEDGKKEVFSNVDFDIENQTIAGLPYTVDEIWVVAPKTVQATLHFMGAEIRYNVNVVESPLENFEMTWFPNCTDYEDRYSPVFDGAEFTLTFKDGTQETVVLSDENTSYGTGDWLQYKVAVGDYTIQILEGWNEYDEIIYGFCCLDKFVDYEGVWFDKSREIDNVEVENFSMTADGMILHVDYTDGTKDTLNLNTVSCMENGKKGYIGYAKTENGITEFSVIKIIENGEVVGYSLNILDEEIIINGQCATLGDVDGNGDISIMDVTLVQQHIAQEITLSDVALESADTDKNFSITVMDATRIQLYIAKAIDKF
ncbi:MAG: hypothetical protein IJ275_06380 [Ruminococcus sp.]|nr:hypothetical protein [Ruminococcus sp.]